MKNDMKAPTVVLSVLLRLCTEDTSAGISSVGQLVYRMEVLQIVFSNTISWSMVYSLRTFLSLFFTEFFQITSTKEHFMVI